LAKHFRPVEKDFDSDFRGLARISRRRYLEAAFGPPPPEVVETLAARPPVSFFIDGLDQFTETDAVALAKHLNLYMGHFWRETPRVVIRDVSSQEPGPTKPTKTTSIEDLPTAISANELDPYLLDLLLVARSGNPRLRFIQYYQVLEYAAFYWTEESVKTSIRRLLSSPDLPGRLDDYVPRLIEALTPTRANDEHKIKRVVETAVDPRRVWP
jgi:hypothetical protein